MGKKWRFTDVGGVNILPMKGQNFPISSESRMEGGFPRQPIRSFPQFSFWACSSCGITTLKQCHFSFVDSSSNISRTKYLLRKFGVTSSTISYKMPLSTYLMLERGSFTEALERQYNIQEKIPNRCQSSVSEFRMLCRCVTLDELKSDVVI